MLSMRLLGALAAMGLLAGCVGSEIEAMRNASPSGSAFTQGLAEEYRQITVFEADEMYDWRDAGYFARKGLRAAAGEVVEPEQLGNWKLPQDKLDEMGAARARMLELLNASARDKFPSEAAHTQGRFDCWVEQQEENHQPDHIAACRDEFYAALAALEELMAPPEEVIIDIVPESFLVYFAFDSAILSQEAQAVIDEVIAAANETPGAEFSVTGYTDRAGPPDYNLKLSLRRAESVRDALIAQGVPAELISIAGRGEADPAVPTPDGVAEQANRRAVINIQ